MPDIPNFKASLPKSKYHLSIGIASQIETYQKELIQLCSYHSNDIIEQLGQGEIEGLSMITIPTRELCQQYHDLIIANNADLKNNSMIVRSVEEMMQSSAIVMFVYKGMLLGAIRIQEQEGISTLDYEPIHQRCSLIIHPEFRGKKIGGISLVDYLIKEINGIAIKNNRLTYGIVKLRTMINRNIAAGSIAIKIDNLINFSEELYRYVVESRGQDFYDLKDSEHMNDYHILISSNLYKRLLRATILASDAQSS